MQKVVFVDRDGVINKENPAKGGYVTCPREFIFLPRVKKAVKLLNDSGFKVIIISNQAGVAKGLYAKRILDAITKKFLNEIKAFGGKIYKVYYCTHQTSDNCSCRKPKAGLFRQAAQDLKINFKNTYFIGDAERDVIAGKRVHLKTITVLCGRTKKADIDKWHKKPDYIAKDLLEAAKNIVLKK